MSPVNVIYLVEDEHSFVLFFDDESYAATLKMLGQWAADPQLPSFTWYKAALLSQKIRHLRQMKERHAH